MRKSEFCQRLGLDVPIVQAPMASSTTPELVAAVSNAGERTYASRARSLADGIEILEATWKIAADRAARLGVEMPG